MLVKKQTIMDKKVIPSIKTGGKNPFATESVISFLNMRIAQEENSSRLYHAMSLWLNDKGYMGAAKQWEKDSDGEMEHAGWAKEYLLSLGIKPEVPALDRPEQEFMGLPDIIRKSFDHEVFVTQQCNNLASQALKSGDHLLYQLALKYMQEQQEELDKLQTLLDKLETFGETKDVLLMIDQSFE